MNMSWADQLEEEVPLCSTAFRKPVLGQDCVQWAPLQSPMPATSPSDRSPDWGAEGVPGTQGGPLMWSPLSSSTNVY